MKFDQNGLIPAIVQDAATRKVLMMAYMNEESLKLTRETGKATFFSRSRNEIWVKGETSGNYQYVEDILVDCDEDCLLITVKPAGPACHTNHTSCFYRAMEGDALVDAPDRADSNILNDVFAIICDRRDNPKEGSYTNYLFDKGIDKILKKVGEECAETIIASKNNVKDEIALEASDLIYHLMVMLCDRGLTPQDLFDELKKRENKDKQK
ncbi:MAG: bifunctional phosphoribosyl-AMP cyclohydrolase/phosphoribosyl-ATP diphosphatase HisIE [Ruminococcaceae bacterium]|nr:bifunctional phosphoribosyl-AMP cyclohydrolase/phosphoribosyl-ATP diphosphatase HisIE [Oscillospiraceae bacterium]